MSGGRDLIGWAVLAAAVAGWVAVLLVMQLRRRARTRRPKPIVWPPPPARRGDAAEHELTALSSDGGAEVAQRPTLTLGPELFPGLPDTHLLSECPMVEAPGGPMPLRDWLRHFAGVDAWAEVVSRFYTRAAADPDIAGYFIGVGMERLWRHFLAALMIVTGQGVTVGVVRRMHAAHTAVRGPDGQPITAATWNAVIGILAGVLAELGTPPATLVALATTIAPIRPAIVTEPTAEPVQ